MNHDSFTSNKHLRWNWCASSLKRRLQNFFLAAIDISEKYQILCKTLLLSNAFLRWRKRVCRWHPGIVYGQWLFYWFRGVWIVVRSCIDGHLRRYGRVSSRWSSPLIIKRNSGSCILSIGSSIVSPPLIIKGNNGSCILTIGSSIVSSPMITKRNSGSCILTNERNIVSLVNLRIFSAFLLVFYSTQDTT